MSHHPPGSVLGGPLVSVPRLPLLCFRGRILRWDTTLSWLSQLSQKGAFGLGGWREGRKFCDYASEILLCYVVRARCLMADVRFRAFPHLP